MRFSAAEKLLILANVAKSAATANSSLMSRKAELRAIAADPGLDWQAAFDLARLNAVLPLTLTCLKAEKLASRIPSELLSRWESEVAPIVARGTKRSEWSGRMLQALSDAGIEVIVLKGSLFADVLYGDRTYKKMNDVDVMIRRKDAERAIAVLIKVGFTSVGALFGRKELSEDSHHTPPYVSEDLMCVVGLHWGLASPRSAWKPDTAGIWKRKLKVEVAGSPAFGMSWEDNLLHLCIHLPFFKTGLRELADVYNVALSNRIDWSVLASRARNWGAEDALYRVLGLTDALLPLAIPTRHLRAWESAASLFTRKDTQRRLGQPSSILHSRSTQAGMIEKAYAVFKLTESYPERVKAWAGMWAFLIWPKREELLKLAALRQELNSSRGQVIKARLNAPLQLWRAMARDHGHLPLAVMTLANAGIVLGDTARISARRVMGRKVTGRSLREHPAFKLLEVLE